MKLLCDGKIDSLAVAESLCGATVSLSDLLGLKDIVHNTHFLRGDYGHHRMTAESLLHAKVAFGKTQSTSAAVRF